MPPWPSFASSSYPPSRREASTPSFDAGGGWLAAVRSAGVAAVGAGRQVRRRGGEADRCIRRWQGGPRRDGRDDRRRGRRDNGRLTVQRQFGSRRVPLCRARRRVPSSSCGASIPSASEMVGESVSPGSCCRCRGVWRRLAGPDVEDELAAAGRAGPRAENAPGAPPSAPSHAGNTDSGSTPRHTLRFGNGGFPA